MATLQNSTTPTTSTYSGIAFPPKRSAGSGFFATDTDLDLIQNSIRVILNTKKGSMPMAPNFGSSAQDLLFQPINNTTQGLVIEAITNDINQWEPRVSVISVIAASTDNTRIFQLTLRMKATGAITTQTVSLSAV